MKAISLWQPWASLIALEKKRIETRHWSIAYRGPIAIHAAKRWNSDMDEIATMFGVDGELPLGALVCVAELYDVYTSIHLRTIPGLLSDEEERYGNYGPGRFGWMLRNVRKLVEPIPYRGAQGIFEVPDELLKGVLP